MRYAVVTRAGIPSHQARVPIGKSGVRPLQQPIARCIQLVVEIPILDHQLHVGVVEQKIIVSERRRVGAIKRCIARLFEIVERKTV